MSLLSVDDDLGTGEEERESDFASPVDGDELAGTHGGSTGFDEVDTHEIGTRGEEQAARPRKRKRSTGGSSDLPALPFGSIVKVLVKKAPWTYTAPWRKESQKACSGSGFLLGSNRLVITGAHVVHRATSVIVQAQVGAPTKYAARVECIGRDVDLAILKIDDDRFWLDKTPLEVRVHCSGAKSLFILEPNEFCGVVTAIRQVPGPRRQRDMRWIPNRWFEHFCDARSGQPLGCHCHRWVGFLKVFVPLMS